MRAFPVWAGERDINSRSIGIELVNPGHDLGYRNFPEPQMRRWPNFASEILARHPIPPRRVLGHSDVAPGRKRDPGELFDWQWLAAQGDRPLAGVMQHLFLIAGCSIRPSPEGLTFSACNKGWRAMAMTFRKPAFMESRRALVITAFQRHFRPANVDGVADAQTAAILQQSADLTRPALPPIYSRVRWLDGRFRLRGRKVRAPRKHGAG